jgi:hypothetical protein
MLVMTLGCLVQREKNQVQEVFSLDVEVRIANCPWTRMELYYVTDLGRVLEVDYKQPKALGELPFSDHLGLKKTKKETVIRKSLFGKKTMQFEYLPGNFEMVIDGRSKGLFKPIRNGSSLIVRYEVFVDCAH